MQSRINNKDCSLDLSPHPVACLEIEDGRDASSRDAALETKQQEEVKPETGDHWISVTPTLQKHMIRRENRMVTAMLAHIYVAYAGIARAVLHSLDFTKLKPIPGVGFKFNCDGSFLP